MILPDTSVWIEFFRRKALFASLRQRIEVADVVTVSCIFGELLQGAKTEKEEKILTEYWSSLPQVFEAGLWIDAGIYSRSRSLVKKGVGLVDAAIIIASKRANAQIWTLDKKLLSVLEPEIIYTG